LAAGVFGYSQ
jgi:hypothetical protein